MHAYHSRKLFEEPGDVYRYHELVWKEVNALVELQMEILLHLYLQFAEPLWKDIFW